MASRSLKCEQETAMTTTEKETTIEEVDRPYLEHAIRHCKYRRATAWNAEERAMWTARIAANEKHLKELG